VARQGCGGVAMGISRSGGNVLVIAAVSWWLSNVLVMAAVPWQAFQGQSRGFGSTVEVLGGSARW
jgi:hypothetical protein